MDRESDRPLILGHLEATVMQILWDEGEKSVRDVVERLGRPLAYTTVMTTLDRLFKKSMLERRKSERAFFYRPRWTRAEWEQKQAGDLMSGWLAGSRPSGEMLISCLVDAVGAYDAALLDELEEKIRRKRAELRGGGRA